MPRNKAPTWREKSVLVTVYVESIRKRRFITNNGQNKHHHHHHLSVHKNPRQGGGYNRRAELLEYSRRLRESAKSHKTPLLQLKPKTVDSLQRLRLKEFTESHKTPLLQLQPKTADSLQRSRSQIVPVQNKLRSTRVPTCFGALSIKLPGFSRTNRDTKEKSRNGQSTKAKMISIVKRLRVQKKGGFFSRMFGSLGRKR